MNGQQPFYVRPCRFQLVFWAHEHDYKGGLCLLFLLMMKIVFHSITGMYTLYVQLNSVPGERVGRWFVGDGDGGSGWFLLVAVAIQLLKGIFPFQTLQQRSLSRLGTTHNQSF